MDYKELFKPGLIIIATQENWAPKNTRFKVVTWDTIINDYIRLEVIHLFEPRNKWDAVIGKQFNLRIKDLELGEYILFEERIISPAKSRFELIDV